MPARIEPPARGLEASTPAGQIALASLLTQPQFRDQLMPRKLAEVKLSADPKGLHRGRLSATTTPGSYSVTYRIRAEHPELGVIERTETVSVAVGIGEIDLDRSNLQVRLLEQSMRGSELEVMIRPQDFHGNYLGPDNASLLTLASSSGQLAAARDLGEGTYAFPILVAPDEDPTLTLAVAGVEVFAGLLSELPQAWEPFSASLLIVLVVLLILVTVALVWTLIRLRRAGGAH
jgi:hypothetical protein